MSSTTEQNSGVLEYRLARVRNAPRNWTIWVAAFTAANGFFIWQGQDLMVLAGLLFPYLFGGFIPHFVGSGALLAVVAAGRLAPWLYYIVLLAYLADTAIAGYLGSMAGLVMHVVVLAFVGMAALGSRHLAKQLAAAQANGA